MLGGAGDLAAPAATEELRGSSNSGDMEEDEKRGGGGGEEGGGGDDSSHRGGGGNRWPKHETLELLRIRSEMDSIFRDSTPKAPLWEEVSRKLAELGYKRSAKKCKEKFENVYKYHKRTKDGRTAKHDGKNYRFFQELEAFDGQQQAVERKNHHLLLPPPPPPQAALPWGTAVNSHQIMGTIPSGGNNGTSTTTTPAANSTGTINFTITPPQQVISHLSPTVVTPAEPISSSQPLNPSPQSVFHPSYHHRGQHHHNNGTGGRRAVSATTHLFSSSTSSSTASDEEMEEKGKGTRKRKRKLKDFFHRLTKDVIKKQEELQKRFLETVEKLDRERLDREGAWRVQEMARINREHEILIRERSTAAAKDAAVLALLQKVSGGGVGGAQIAPQKLSSPSPSPSPLVASQPALVSPNYQTHDVAVVQKPMPITTNVVDRIDRNGEGVQTVATTTTTMTMTTTTPPTSSRWPKTEVHALIGLRTKLDEKYQENVPKGPLWEEISTEMKKLGYNRNAKRCKEKWENINKYFKKVKESSRKRPEDSKTCPYFHQLDALYREKSNKVMDQPQPNPTVTSGYIEANPIRAVEPTTTIHHWLPHPHPPPPLQPPRHAEVEDEDEEDEDDYEDEETDDDQVDTGVRGFEIVQNKSSAMTVGGNGE